MPGENEGTKGDEQANRLEMKIKETELRIREKELSLREKELEEISPSKRQSPFSSTTLIVGIIAALLGFLGTVTAKYLEGTNALELERRRLTSSLIIEAIRTGNPEEAARNLKFFLDVGFLEDVDGKIAEYVANTKKVPVLPPASRALRGLCPEGTCLCADGGCSRDCCSP